MRFFLAGVAVVVALAGTAEAIRAKVPAVRVHMELISTHEVAVFVDGLQRPDPEDLVLYPAGHPGTAVHPTTIDGNGESGPVSLAIVYDGTSNPIVGTLRQAFDHIELSRDLPPGSQVTLVDYSNVAETLAWSPAAKLDGNAFATHAGGGATYVDAVSRALDQLDRGPTPRRVLAIFGNFCDLDRGAAARLESAMDNRVEVHTFVFGLDARKQCPRTPAYSAMGIMDPLEPAWAERSIRMAVHRWAGTSWTAEFDVRPLGVLNTGDRMMVLDVAGYETESRRVLFPGPKVDPSWFSSRLRQLGLGALLVGLIALLVRSRQRRA